MLCVGGFESPAHASVVQKLFPTSGKQVTLQNLATVLALPLLATAGELCYRGYQTHKATVGKDVTTKSSARAVKDAVFNKAAWTTVWNDAKVLVKKSDVKAWQRVKDLYAQHPALVITTALALTYATSTTLHFAFLKKNAPQPPKPPIPTPAPQPAPAPAPAPVPPARPLDPKEIERLTRKQEAELALMIQNEAESKQREAHEAEAERLAKAEKERLAAEEKAALAKQRIAQEARRHEEDAKKVFWKNPKTGAYGHNPRQELQTLGGTEISADDFLKYHFMRSELAAGRALDAPFFDPAIATGPREINITQTTTTNEELAEWYKIQKKELEANAKEFQAQLGLDAAKKALERHPESIVHQTADSTQQIPLPRVGEILPPGEKTPNGYTLMASTTGAVLIEKVHHFTPKKVSSNNQNSISSPSASQPNPEMSSPKSQV